MEYRPSPRMKPPWGIKLKHDEKLQGAFTGVRGKKRDFKERILAESKTNTAVLRPLTELEKRAESVFGDTPEKVALLQALDFAKLLACESNPILKKKIIGKMDVDIAAMIQKLGNSDWVNRTPNLLMPYFLIKSPPH